MTQEWVDVQIPAAVDSGELLGLLGDPLVQGAWEDQGMTHLYWSRQHWNGDQLAQVCAALDQLDPSGRSSGAVQVGDLPHQDWNRQWAQSVKPLRVGRRLVIRPSWESASLLDGDLDIILDPKQAFGTGHHATTRMLLERLEELIRGGETVLDVGSGSGILAMAALRLGAQSAVGVEIDPVAVDCARECASQNAFGPELELICGTLSDVAGDMKPDLVVANLDRQTLLLLADELAVYGAAGSRLFFSGLLVEQVEEVMARYAGLGLYPVNQREQEGWVALELRRSEPCEGQE
jgi:ribosomal protein L11 methyltransferase